MRSYVEDGVFYMTSCAKAQKVMNISRDRGVGLIVETGASYAELQGVMVRGTCEITGDVETVRRVMDHRRGSPECRAEQHAAGHPATRSITAAVP